MHKVIYINTTGHMSGAAVSMGEVIRTLAGLVEPILLTPRGSATAFLRGAIKEIVEVPWLTQFDHTRYGRYRGTRWLIALRELVLLPSTAWSVWRFSKRVKNAGVIHLNEITGIIPAVLLKRFIPNVPLVVHVRANMGEQGRGLRSKLLWHLVQRHVQQLICIDETVRSTLPPGIQAKVIHNSLNVERIRNTSYPMAAVFQSANIERLINVGIVGSIIRVKGVIEFVDAAIEICRNRTDVRFYIVGAGLRKLHGFRAALLGGLKLAEDTEALVSRKISESGMTDRILMTGHISDLATVYEALDILCFPSHYDAPGRPIFEAALFGKPSIVAISNPLPDTLVDGVTGIAIPARDSGALAAAIIKLVDNQSMRRDLGEAARLLARRICDPDKNAAEVAEVYRLTIAQSQSGLGAAREHEVGRTAR
jgi:glycosyltransferase involved in cell wall biosynthesis